MLHHRNEIGKSFNLINFKITATIPLSKEDYEKLCNLSIGRTTATKKFGAKSFLKTIIGPNSSIDTLEKTKRYAKILDVLKKYE
ncbi:hypothetical protein GCM10022289_10020 [Pedobacter jeongneungensis]|uniref:Uncharacterized protein n=2 Tax=Pedobacter jeongneungensis TaxID=947309 RepID=A0ABP8B7H2_9SPHI